ncbi:TPA: cobalamin biosynthesis protein CbiX [Candidatus Latescibacteria bacterium]|nr:cobalamin biosynthesis protein CbiX [Candidatus Latescibacterota bacterium]|tara:strand:+ start:48 stop:428 length:381 start_codon:yes stop_codon:yes gene_type:complete
MPTAILIVDHGSRRQEANDMLVGVGEIVRKQRPDLIVNIAHMELAEPDIPQGIQKCIDDGATEIVVHPYMLSPGRHATSDIPEMAQEAAAPYPNVTVRVTGPLGLHEKLGEVILERAGLHEPQLQS